MNLLGTWWACESKGKIFTLHVRFGKSALFQCSIFSSFLRNKYTISGLSLLSLFFISQYEYNYTFRWHLSGFPSTSHFFLSGPRSDVSLDGGAASAELHRRRIGEAQRVCREKRCEGKFFEKRRYILNRFLGPINYFFSLSQSSLSPSPYSLAFCFPWYTYLWPLPNFDFTLFLCPPSLSVAPLSHSFISLPTYLYLPMSTYPYISLYNRCRPRNRIGLVFYFCACKGPFVLCTCAWEGNFYVSKFFIM